MAALTEAAQPSAVRSRRLLNWLGSSRQSDRALDRDSEFSSGCTSKRRRLGF